MFNKNIFLVFFSLVLFVIFCLPANAQFDTEITYGSEYVFNMASTSNISLDNLSSSKVIVAYRDGGGNFNQGTAIIADISNNTITYGSEYVFNSAITDYVSVKMLSENKAILVYKDNGNSNYGTAVIASISDNTITYGSEYVFNTALTNHVSVTMLLENKVIIAYQDSKDGYNQGKAIIANINGDTITFGSEYVFNTASIEYISMATLSENKFVIAYKDIAEGNQGTAIIGTVSNNEINFGSKYIFNTSDTRYISTAVLSDNKVTISYQDYGNNKYGTAIIANISGDVITYGSEYVFNPAITNNVSIASFSENKITISYQDYGNNQYGTAVIANTEGAVSVEGDNTITHGSEYVFNSANTGVTFTKILTQSKFLITYQDKMSNLNYGTAVIGNIPEIILEPEPQPTPEADEPLAQEHDVITIIDGDLIRNSNAQDTTKFDIYIVKLINNKKFKRLILSPHVFESYEHLNWIDVKNVDEVTMNSYISSGLIRAVQDLKVYKLTASGDTGTKQWLNITAEEFESQGYDNDSIYEINSTDRDAYITGVDIISWFFIIIK